MAKAPFQWDDPFFFEDQLSEEERMVRDTVRDYAQEKLMPKVIQVNRDEEFDYDAFHGFAELGIYGTLVPEEYGGSDLNNVCYGLTSRELERVDSAYRSIAGLQVSLVIHPIMTFGSDEQKKKYVPKLVSGDLIGCFGLTEPDHGSDPGGMISKAVKQDGGFVLNGNKMWISNSPVADVMVVWAKLDDVIRGFILEKGMKGLSTPKINGKLSLRASVTGEIVMEDVFVPEENLLPGAKGLGGPFSCLNKARTGISWGALGSAEFCWHAARNYTVERKQFNRPLAANQLIQKKLADMQTEIAIALQAVLRVTRLLDEGRCPPEAISIVKRNSAGKALEIARVARDMHGAVGIMEEFHVMRHLMNLETVNTYEGTHDVHALILGRAITGIQAFFPE